MKTPRDILLARHQAAEPKLSAIRKSVLAAVPETPGTIQAGRGFAVRLVPSWFLILWRELILPSHRVWSGLATIWALIVLVNLCQHEPANRTQRAAAGAPPVMVSWGAEQRLMNELLADRQPPIEADRPANGVPRPRTQRFSPAAG